MHPNRTIEQHNSEWLYYQMIAKETGHTAYEIYEILAAKLLRVKLESGDEAFIKPTDLTTIEHNEYMEQIRCEMAQFGIILPDPEKCIARAKKTKKIIDK